MESNSRALFSKDGRSDFGAVFKLGPGESLLITKETIQKRTERRFMTPILVIIIPFVIFASGDLPLNNAIGIVIGEAAFAYDVRIISLTILKNWNGQRWNEEQAFKPKRERVYFINII